MFKNRLLEVSLNGNGSQDSKIETSKIDLQGINIMHPFAILKCLDYCKIYGSYALNMIDRGPFPFF